MGKTARKPAGSSGQFASQYRSLLGQYRKLRDEVRPKERQAVEKFRAWRKARKGLQKACVASGGGSHGHKGLCSRVQRSRRGEHKATKPHGKSKRNSTTHHKKSTKHASKQASAKRAPARSASPMRSPTRRSPPQKWRPFKFIQDQPKGFVDYLEGLKNTKAGRVSFDEIIENPMGEHARTQIVFDHEQLLRKKMVYTPKGKEILRKYLIAQHGEGAPQHLQIYGL